MSHLRRIYRENGKGCDRVRRLALQYDNLDDTFLLVKNSIVSEQEMVAIMHTINRDHDPPFLTRL